MNKQNVIKLALLGAKDSAPLVLAAVPFGIIYGALAQATGLSLWAVLAMSVIVFAGSSQFIAVGLIASGTAWPVVVLTTFFVNFRHLLYAANLMPHLTGVAKKIKGLMAFFLTDETFAVASIYAEQAKSKRDFISYYFGSALFMYINWNICTLLGVMLGENIPNIGAWGLDMAMVVAFIGIVVPALHNKPTVACALTAGVVSLLTYSWPHQSGLLFSSLSAIAVALFVESKSKVNNVDRNIEVSSDNNTENRRGES